VDATIDHRNFGWTCHVCYRDRPNDRISVARHLHVFPSGVEMTQHVRYCNDDPDCTEMAQHHDHTGLALIHANEELDVGTAGWRCSSAGMFFGLAFGLLWLAIILWVF
jgi:hypothetical protein